MPLTRRRLPLVAALLVIVGLNAAVYRGAGSADFINWDDDTYVADNALVLGGLTGAGWRRAWALDTPPYYIPVTWLSFMLNAEMTGAEPGPFHLTNVALHTANAALLLLFLHLVTGKLARSFFAAALFAVHPLHVEGVMWIAQRKEMLSAFFGLIALLAYHKYVREAGTRRAGTWHAALLLATLLSLLSKPMWLTLPVLLLLLDLWPLARTHLGLRRLVVEKVPVAGLCALVLVLNASSFEWDAPQLARTIDVTPFSAGWGTIPISYLTYVWKTVVPYPLAVPYTNFAQAPSPVAVGGAVVALLALTVCALRYRRRAPWIAVGWSWFLVSAATVLFSFGSGKVTPLADHWAYVPHIGLFAAIAWSLPPVRATAPARGYATAVACALAIVVLGGLAHAQARVWRDAPTLWAHTIAHTERNHVAHWLWGIHAWEAGDHALGARLMREAQRLNPTEAFYVQRLGNLLLAAGREGEALEEYRRLLQEPLAAAEVLTGAGVSVLRRIGPDAALPLLERAAGMATASAGADASPARFYLWLALAAADRAAEAEAVFDRIVAADHSDRAAFCAEAVSLMKRLTAIDLAWARFAPVVAAQCPGNAPQAGP